MKTISILGVLFIVATSLAQTKDGPHNRCPKPSGSTFGACVFNPAVNCVDDDKCTGGQICCPDGCNKVCMNPLSNAEPKPYIPPAGKGTCPVVPPKFGACVFDPSVNCAGDNDCKVGQLCCNDGCGKICKDAMGTDEPVNPAPVYEGCPQAKRTFGTCVFTPGVNCIGDNNCKDGQVCCPDGCGKVCKNIKKPQEEDRCPASRGDSVVGICTFDPKINCVDDSACYNGQICCNSGCNKVCVNPKPTPVHEATKP